MSRATNNLERMQALGVASDPIKQLHWELGRSRLGVGRVAGKFGGRLERSLDRIEEARALQAVKPILPPKLPVEESLHLGELVEGPGQYRVYFNDLPRGGITIGGATGAGKTVLTAHLAKQFYTRVPTTLTDGKDEAGRFLAHFPGAIVLPLTQQRFNPLRSRRDQRGFVRYFADEFGRAVAIPRTTANAFSKVLWQLCHNPADLPAMADLVPALDRLAESSGRAPLRTAARALEALLPIMGKWVQVRSGVEAFREQPQLLILPRKDLPAPVEYFFYALLFKDRMDAISLRGHSTALSEVIIFDEARRFFGVEFENTAGSGRFNIQTEITTKARSYGLCLVIASQSVSRLQKSVVDNAATFIAMRTHSEAEAKFCARRLGLPDERYRELMELETGLAYVLSPSCPRAVKIRIPYHDLGDYLSEAEVAQRMAPIWEDWDQRTTFAPRRTDKDHALNFRSLLGETIDPVPVSLEEHTEADPVEPEASETLDTPPPEIVEELLRFLRACQDSSDRGVMALYRELGWSAGRGHRVKSQLLETDLIATARSRSPKGGRPREVIQLTPKGTRFLSHHESP